MPPSLPPSLSSALPPLSPPPRTHTHNTQTDMQSSGPPPFPSPTPHLPLTLHQPQLLPPPQPHTLLPLLSQFLPLPDKLLYLTHISHTFPRPHFSLVRLRHPRVDAHPPPAAHPAVARPLRRAPGPRHLQAPGQPLPPPRLLLLTSSSSSSSSSTSPPPPVPALRAVTFAPMDWYGVQGWAAAGAAAWAEQHGKEPSHDELCRGHFPHAEPRSVSAPHRRPPLPL